VELTSILSVLVGIALVMSTHRNMCLRLIKWNGIISINLMYIEPNSYNKSHKLSLHLKYQNQMDINGEILFNIRSSTIP